MLADALFDPDLIVTSDDGTDIALVVEFRAEDHSSETERLLKEYMLGMRCPLALVVTPQNVTVYRDEYESESADSIHLVGRYPAPSAFASAGTGRSFENAAWRWLENLPSDVAFQSVPPELRRVVQTHIVPALMQGSLRAAGPRY